MSNLLSGLVFPLDPTGKLPSNKIVDEYHVITAANWRTYHYVVPKKGPYFEDSLVMTYKNTSGAVVPLVLGVDWVPSFWYIGASRGCAKQIYGGITFLNTSLVGNIKISYQTIGGEWVLDDQAISEILAQHLNNPLTTTWEVIANVPKVFPPEPHEWNLVDLVGAKDLNDSLQEIVEVLRLQSSEGLSAHLSDVNNPHHVTKAQVGLGSVTDLALAPLAGAATLTDNNYYLTPASARLIIKNAVGDAFNAFVARRDNPHGVTAAQVGAYTKLQTDNLLSNKLNVTDIAFDTSRFNGMTYPEVKADVLTGTAYNASRLAGRSYDDLVSDVLIEASAQDTFGGYTPDGFKNWVLSFPSSDSILFNGKTEEQLANYYKDNNLIDAYRLGGRTDVETKNWVLQGTANNSTRLDNKTYPELVSAISVEVGGNANTLEGKTKAEVIAEALSGTAANASKVYNKTLAELKEDVLSGTAADSSKLGGKSYAEVKAGVLEGRAADSSMLDGKTFAQVVAAAAVSGGGSGGDAVTFGGRSDVEYKEWVLEGKSADSDLLDGMTFEEVKDEIYLDADDYYVSQRIIAVEEDLANTMDRIFTILKVSTTDWTPESMKSIVRFKIENIFDSNSDSDANKTNNVSALVSLDIEKLLTSASNFATVNISVLGNTSDLGLTVDKLSSIADQIKLGYYADTDNDSIGITLTLPYDHSTGIITYYITSFDGVEIDRDEFGYNLDTSIYTVVPVTPTFVSDKVDLVYKDLVGKVGDSTTATNIAINALKTELSDDLSTSVSTLNTAIGTAIDDEVIRADIAYATKTEVGVISNSLENLTSAVEDIGDSLGFEKFIPCEVIEKGGVPVSVINLNAGRYFLLFITDVDVLDTNGNVVFKANLDQYGKAVIEVNMIPPNDGIGSSEMYVKDFLIRTFINPSTTVVPTNEIHISWNNNISLSDGIPSLTSVYFYPYISLFATHTYKSHSQGDIPSVFVKNGNSYRAVSGE